MHDPKKKQELLKLLIAKSFEFNQTHNIYQRQSEAEVYNKDIVECLEINKHKKRRQNTRYRLWWRISGAGDRNYKPRKQHRPHREQPKKMLFFKTSATRPKAKKRKHT